MGKKGSWFSAIKRAFSPNSKEKHKPSEGVDKKHAKEKKRAGKGILGHGEGKSFFPLFREPSSIEKILGEADQLLIKHPPASSEQPKSPPRRPISPHVASPQPESPPRRPISPHVASPQPASPPAAPKVHSLKVPSPKAASPKASPFEVSSSKPADPKVRKIKKTISLVKTPEPTLQEQHISATKIQAAFRGYLARRSVRGARGLVRLQGVVKGQSVKRQTANAMKQMQLLVRVQTQIQSRRIHMLENQALQRQANKEVESTVSKWTLNQLSENQDWDDSMITKEEVDARRRKKVEAVVKRERAMAYAYSHKLWKANPKASMDDRFNGHPWWWNWLDRQLPQQGASQSQSVVTKNISSTPPRSISGYKPSPRHNAGYDNHDSVTPRSSRSAVIPFRPKQFHTPSRSPLSNIPTHSKYSKPRASGDTPTSNAPLKDDDSLVSCPPFSSVPNYMAPTASAKAKARPYSNLNERFSAAGTPGSESKRRFSFPLTPTIGSFKWNKGANRDTASQAGFDRRSIGEMSADSTVSMPAGLLGRKPFNRFV